MKFRWNLWRVIHPSRDHSIIQALWKNWPENHRNLSALFPSLGPIPFGIFGVYVGSRKFCASPPFFDLRFILRVWKRDYYHVSWDAKPWGVAKYGFLRDQKAFCSDHSRYNIIYNDTWRILQETCRMWRCSLAIMWTLYSILQIQR